VAQPARSADLWSADHVSRSDFTISGSHVVVAWEANRRLPACRARNPQNLSTLPATKEITLRPFQYPSGIGRGTVGETSTNQSLPAEAAALASFLPSKQQAKWLTCRFIWQDPVVTEKAHSRFRRSCRIYRRANTGKTISGLGTTGFRSGCLFTRCSNHLRLCSQPRLLQSA